MNEVASAAAVGLAVVFAWAGASKLVSPHRTTAAFEGLGLPVPALLARLTSVVELSVAAALLLAPGPAAVAAVLLLAVFTAVLWRSLRAGLGVPCACFGSARSEPVSRVDIVRNALLIGLGVVAGRTAEVVMPSIEALVLVSTAVLAGAVVLGVLRLGERTSAA